MIGRTLSHYEILEPIGSGGMGDVYLAKDGKLERNVALKILPSELAENPERRERFEREAKSLAALNHPHIVTVFSVEQVEGVHFFTMELVRGKPLSELIPKSGFSLARFFDVAIPLADAVAAATADDRPRHPKRSNVFRRRQARLLHGSIPIEPVARSYSSRSAQRLGGRGAAHLRAGAHRVHRRVVGRLVGSLRLRSIGEHGPLVVGARDRPAATAHPTPRARFLPPAFSRRT